MQQYGSLCYIYIFGCYLSLVWYTCIMSRFFLLAVSHVSCGQYTLQHETSIQSIQVELIVRVFI
jgi:hypothetical protein